MFYNAQKKKISINDFFSKCDQIRRKLRIWSHLLKKSLMQNFIFCVATNKATLKKEDVEKGIRNATDGETLEKEPVRVKSKGKRMP